MVFGQNCLSSNFENKITVFSCVLRIVLLHHTQLPFVLDSSTMAVWAKPRQQHIVLSICRGLPTWRTIQLNPLKYKAFCSWVWS